MVPNGHNHSGPRPKPNFCISAYTIQNHNFVCSSMSIHVHLHLFACIYYHLNSHMYPSIHPGCRSFPFGWFNTNVRCSHNLKPQNLEPGTPHVQKQTQYYTKSSFTLRAISWIVL